MRPALELAATAPEEAPMSSPSPKPSTDSPEPEPSPDRSTAKKAAVALPITVLMPFIVLYHALRGIWSDQASRGILVTAALLLVAGTIIFMILEGFSPIDSFYFSFITLATIGYGDLSPATDLGKLVTVVYSTAGLGIMAALITTIAAQRRSRSREHTAGEAEA
jgi:voltage-gated potassium channel Kch